MLTKQPETSRKIRRRYFLNCCRFALFRPISGQTNISLRRQIPLPLQTALAKKNKKSSPKTAFLRCKKFKNLI